MIDEPGADPQGEIALLRRQLGREIRARQQAELLGEEGTRALYEHQAELSLLAAIATAANAESTFASALGVALKSLADFGSWELGHVYGCEPGATTLTSLLIWYDGGSGLYEAFRHATEAMPVRSGVGLPGRVLESGLPVLSPDLASDNNFPSRPAALAAGLASGYAFAVRPSTGGLAVIELFSIRRATGEPRLAALMPQVTAQLAQIFSRYWSEAESFRRNQELEERVRQRTEMLSAKVRELDASMTALRQAQQSLQVHNRALSSAASGILIVDALQADTPIIYCNPAFEKLTGYSAHEVQGRNCRMLQGADTDPASVEVLRTAVRRGEPCHVVIKNYRRDGTAFWNQIIVAPVRDAEGKLTHFIGIQEDVSMRKETEANLLSAKEASDSANLALERAGRLKDEFLAAMSHELRTPLNAVIGMTQILAEQLSGPLNEDQRGMVRLIEESGQHLLALINDVLDLSKIEAGKVVLRFEELAIRDAADAAVRMILEQALKKRITVSCTVDPALTKMRADQRRLKQILVNLLANAVKFTPEGGRVTLAVTPSADSPAVVFAVSDTGIGIAAADLGRLFRSFEQIDTKLSRQFEGTGLGLALVARMVELHGGKISVVSEPDRGSCFTVVMPLGPAIQAVRRGSAEAAVGAVIPDAIPGARRRLRIVVAEDSPTNQHLVRCFLESIGHEVILAVDGDEAFKKVFSLRPDVVLMDVQMPGTDGLEAIRMIRAARPVAATPIIALTALAMEADRRMCLAAGADHYLSKPVGLGDLAEMIERATAAPPTKGDALG
jgi:PAS domain S-box-containing protein